MQSTLQLAVMDHDDYNTDDAMGTAEVEVRSLPINTTMECKRPLQNVGSIIAKGSIFLSLLLEVLYATVLQP
jgi:Ca2+-dependent lipid-binding protein